MLNCNNSAAATAAKLFQGCLVYSILWLLRGHLLLGWVWHYLLWPLLLGLFWRPHIVTSVPTFVLVSCYCAKTCAKTQTHIDHLVNFMNEFMKTQVLVLVMGGGWQTVAALLIAASLTLPRLPVPRRLWPFSVEWGSWTHALIAAASFLFPFWTQLWQQRLAACVLLFFSTMGFSAPADC
ncbi:hypothetical protein OEZ86_012927 [Tetradesmus obliquus]|nr:hypothetical protein OEZ86_012927 [Tetradesmus obliquus]